MFFRKRVDDGGGERESRGEQKNVLPILLISFKSKFTLKVHEHIESMF